MKKIQNALVSVSDKTGVVDFCRELKKLGVTIYSTGGTKRVLQEAGIEVKSVAELTNFPEIMDGRVKTLHPGVHAGLLADLSKSEHLRQLEEHHLKSIDLLAVNLYPFEETLKRENATHADLIENIDIGGPAMLRAAAKNYMHTAVVSNPDCYGILLNEISKTGTISEETGKKLAGEVFAMTAYYDSLIACYFAGANKSEFPKIKTLPLKKTRELRYGENPHQKAALYGCFEDIFTKIHGKELSYNNIADISAAAGLITEFDKNAVAITKHTNPSGVGIGNTMKEAYVKAFECDTQSPFGGIIAFGDTVDAEAAEEVDKIFTEVLIAPEFTAEALELLQKKKNRRLLTVNYKLLKSKIQYDFKSVAGGYLTQQSDTVDLDKIELECVTERKPSDEEIKSLIFGQKVCKHVKSNAIVYNSADRTLGVGAGQMSRIDSARIAVEKARIAGLDLKGSTLASDAFFPFADGLIEAAEAGITAVIQPGGSVRDQEVIDAANERGIAMVFTHKRHFRH